MAVCFTAVSTASKELLAEAVTRPRTRAVIVAISPTPTCTVCLDSASKGSGKAVPHHIPSRAPANVHVNTIIPTIVASTVLPPTFSAVLVLCLNWAEHTPSIVEEKASGPRNSSLL